MLTAKEYADSLRAVADFYEANPDIEQPPTRISVYCDDTKENAARVLRALKPCEKVYEETLFKIRKTFGEIKLDFVFMRNVVCIPRVVGQREVEAKLIPERITPSEFIPAHMEDIVEWDCEESLLAVNEIDESAS